MVNFILLPRQPKRASPPLAEVREFVKTMWLSSDDWRTAVRLQLKERMHYSLELVVHAVRAELPRLDLILAMLRNQAYWILNPSLVERLYEDLEDLRLRLEGGWTEILHTCILLQANLAKIHHDLHTRLIPPGERLHALIHSTGPALSHVVFFEEL